MFQVILDSVHVLVKIKFPIALVVSCKINETKLGFGFKSIEIKGTYVLHGKVGWWDVDSKGEQDFSVKIKGMTLSIENDVNYVFFRCLEEMSR